LSLVSSISIPLLFGTVSLKTNLLETYAFKKYKQDYCSVSDDVISDIVEISKKYSTLCSNNISYHLALSLVEEYGKTNEILLKVGVLPGQKDKL